MSERIFRFRAIGNWLMIVFVALLASACGQNEPGDVAAPSVIATSPINTQTSVPVGTTAVTATFSEAVDPATVNATSFLLRGADGTTIPGTVTYSGVIATYTLAGALSPNTTYTATITTTVRDLEGNPVASTFTWQFTTGVAPDVTPPTINSVDPADGTANVPGNRRVTATFSEAIDPASVGATGFTLTGPGGATVAGTVEVSGSTLTFTPGSPGATAMLAPNTAYIANITTVVTDLAGNALASGRTWTFTTGAVLDTTSPTVVLTEPANTQTNIPVNATIAATFSEAINAATLTATSFVVAGPDGTPLVGEYAYSGNTATFTPTFPLAPSTVFTVTVTSAVTDLAGNALISGVVPNPWTFTTNAAPDVTAPSIVLTYPPDQATNVCINSTVTVRFSENIAAADTFNDSTFIVSGPDGVQLDGTLTYNATTRVGTFTQAANFLPNTTYTARVTNGITDRAGNRLVPSAIPNPWTFTVGATNLVCQNPVPLRSLVGFAVVADGGLTITAGPVTVTGDIGLAPVTTCVLCDTDLVLNGTRYNNDAIALQAKADLLLALNDAGGRPTGPDASTLDGQTLTPGVYSAAATMSLSDDALLTLDALGDTNAVWVFQAGTDLNLGARTFLTFANGAQPRNVFWVVNGNMVLGSNGRTGGSFFVNGSINLGNSARVRGRVLSNAGAITLRRNFVEIE